MGKYFTLNELTYSTEAVRRNIDNTPPPMVSVKINRLINSLLDPVREAWGGPITVNSGFRSPVVNKLVGGVASSQHTKGEAADITTGSPEGNKRLFDLIVASGLLFDQLIDEQDYRWLHLSYSSSNNRKQILHLK